MKTVLLIAILGLVLGGGVLLTKQHDSSATKNDSGYSTNLVATSTAQGTSTKTAEELFLEDMIPHHEEAIAASKEILARSESAEVRTLAQEIIATQTKEIDTMKRWYTEWFKKEYVPNNRYMPMMRDTKTLSGSALDIAFLEDMIAHHMHTLMMTQTVGNTTNETLLAFASTIADIQSNEVVAMRILLTELGG
jgi:uncharacterized protein (DUF305 family)